MISILRSLICSTEQRVTAKTNLSRTLTNTEIFLDLESQNEYRQQISERVRRQVHDARSSSLFRYTVTQYGVVESKTKTTLRYAHSTELITVS